MPLAFTRKEGWGCEDRAEACFSAGVRSNGPSKSPFCYGVDLMETTVNLGPCQLAASIFEPIDSQLVNYSPLR